MARRPPKLKVGLPLTTKTIMLVGYEYQAQSRIYKNRTQKMILVVEGRPQHVTSGSSADRLRPRQRGRGAREVPGRLGASILGCLLVVVQGFYTLHKILCVWAL